jgi:ubiquinol-cytochrome c reductase cytochrome c subunit
MVQHTLRRFAAVTALGLLALPAGLMPSREPSPAASPGAASPGRPAPATTTPAAASRGRQLYEQSCTSCHGLAGQGTQRGPSLTRVGAASLDFQLSTGRMPLARERNQPVRRKPAFSANDIKAIVEYASGFGAGGGPQIPTVRPDNVQLGQTLYLDTCAACHSATGAGGALTNGQFAPDLFEASSTQVGEAIRVGPGLMPAFTDKALTGQEVNAIADYLQTLQSRHGHTDRGGLPLGRIGPVTEGMVGWAVGLVLLVLVVRWLGSRTR